MLLIYLKLGRRFDKMTVYEIITNRILEKLEKGTLPWHKPWNGEAFIPKNLINKKNYRGINSLILSLQDFNSPYWLTFNQANSLNGYVKAGERGTPVVFWKRLTVEQEDSSGEITEKTIPLLRYYTVFNLMQCENIPENKIPVIEKRDIPPIKICEEMIDGMPNRPEIRKHTGDRAYYSPKEDYIGLPLRDQFKSPEEYYSTMFHELIHSTGHEKRLNRPTLVDYSPFGTTNYSKEELIAEMGACFLCGYAGIENITIDNSASYVASWLKVLKDDTKLLIIASGAAQRAVDFILNKKEG